MIMLKYGGVHETIGDVVYVVAGRGNVGPELFNKRTLIANLFHGFFLRLAEEAL